MQDIPKFDDQKAADIFSSSDIAFVLTNPNHEDNPIVYVNKAFEKLTGYSFDASVGRNCRFLQCEETDPRRVDRIRRAVENNESIAVTLLNRRADGEEFLNALVISPVFEDQTKPTGKPDFFIGMQREVSSDSETEQLEDFENIISEVQHRVKNHLAMILGLIRLKSRELDGNGELNDITRRVESLQILYDEMSQAQKFRNEDTIQLGAFLSRIASAISHLDGRAGVRTNVDVEPMLIETDQAARIGLIVSEILTNSLQHAFKGRETGLLELRVRKTNEGGLRVTVSDDGVGMPDDIKWPDGGNLGGRIVKGLCQGLNSQLEVVKGSTGTLVMFDIPADKLKG